jgi:hypothetical protein
MLRDKAIIARIGMNFIAVSIGRTPKAFHTVAQGRTEHREERTLGEPHQDSVTPQELHIHFSQRCVTPSA